MWQIVIIVLFTLLGIGLITAGVKENADGCAGGGGGMFFLILAFICTLGYAGAFKSTDPKAIDVYRGRTDIRIVYTIENNDTLDVDSTVVWKEEFRPKEEK